LPTDKNIFTFDIRSQWAKSPKKQSPKKQSVGVHFDNMALYCQCQINKNALLQTVFGDFANWGKW